MVETATLLRGTWERQRRDSAALRCASLLCGFVWAGLLWPAAAWSDEPADLGLSEPTVSGQLIVWHTITLTFDGPRTSETADPNPFTDYRLDVVFRQADRRLVVPGCFAADGNAGQTGAVEGNKWRVHFVPDAAGTWTFDAILTTGAGAAVADMQAGPAAAQGTLVVAPGASDDQAADPWQKGFLRHAANSRYYQYCANGEYFLKAGADSPENFLAYAEFDGTFDTDGLAREGEAAGPQFMHQYAPHVQDWRAGDPVWRGERGKGIIGALNYLASKGMNSVYFIPYNLDGGDGKDTWPWIDPTSRDRFDVSKLDQWQIVLDHMDRLGIMAHIITQETENDQALDGGDLGPARRLYYRELVARFGHKRLLTWNLGEENTNTPEQLQSFVNYFRTVDPYDHPIVVHTYPGQYEKVYTPLLNVAGFDGASLQMNKRGDDTHSETIKWIDRSTAAGRPWLVCLDEYGHGANGVQTDATQYWHDEPRKNCLWANLMAGGAGVEWYFGYTYPHNDLHCEDWRSRDHLWDLTRLAVDFFRRLPLEKMSHADALSAAPDDFCFAQPGAIYAVYLPQGGSTTLDLQQHARKFSVQWFDPRHGGDLQVGSVATVTGPGTVSLGTAPQEPDADWVVLVLGRLGGRAGAMSKRGAEQDALHISLRPTLEEATLVLAFSGWMDGGDVSTGTVSRLVQLTGAQPFADIDPDPFYIFNFPGSMEIAALFRPHCQIQDGLVRRFDIPTNVFYSQDTSNLVLFVGREPNVRWRQFGDCILRLAAEIGVRRILFVGSYGGAVPHTREPHLYVTCSDKRLLPEMLQYGVQRTDYEGPGSFTGYLLTQAPQAKLEMISLVAEIPSYLQGTNVSCIEAMTRRLAKILKLPLDHDSLRVASTRWELEVSQQIERDETLAAQIRKLEAAYDDQLLQDNPDEQ